MSTQPIPTPFDAPLPGEQGAQPIQAQPQAATPFDQPLPGEVPPIPTGQVTNDVGNQVITPMKGESFQDTLKRAIQYHKSLTPAQQQAAINAEVRTMPTKIPEALGAAAGIGVAGPATLAGIGEIPGAVATGLGAAAKGVMPYVVKVGQWAQANPIQAWAALQALKELVPGFKKAAEMVKKSPAGE